MPHAQIHFQRRQNMVTHKFDSSAAPSLKSRLHRRRGRRRLVGCLIASCVVLTLLGLAQVQTAASFILVGAVVVEDFLLLYATGNLAERPSQAVDEREEMVRNRAYRRAYRLASNAIIIPAAIIVVLASFGDPHGILHAIWKNTALVIALGTAGTQILAFLPTMMLAWTEPDPAD
jgi:hypothetical protein